MKTIRALDERRDLEERSSIWPFPH